MNKKGGETDMSDTERTALPEAPASATVKVKSTNGFSWLFTIREMSGTELMKKIDAFEVAVLEKKWTPEQDMRGGGFNSPAVPTKECPIHHIQMKQKLSKTSGKPYFSHSQGVYPNLDMCFGEGYKSEQGQVREPYNGGGEY